MRFHEKDHASIFRDLLKERDARFCFVHQLFFISGLFNGVIVGLLLVRTQRSIWPRRYEFGKVNKASNPTP